MPKFIESCIAKDYDNGVFSGFFPGECSIVCAASNQITSVKGIKGNV